jgi:hypothetical protein
VGYVSPKRTDIYHFHCKVRSILCVNPLRLREHSDLDNGQVEYALRNLKHAGWIAQSNRGGLYELVTDPREEE